MRKSKSGQAIAAIAFGSALMVLGGCGTSASDDSAASENVDTSTLAETIARTSDLDTVAQSLKDSGLAQVFDGVGFYTVLAPRDEAFEELGDDIDLASDDQRPALVAILRDHILPGYLTPEDISNAIDSSGGTISVETVGNHTLRFAKRGDALTVTSEDGVTATLGDAVLASNGVAIPLDTVLKNVTP